jgi:hypothetical protein
MEISGNLNLQESRKPELKQDEKRLRREEWKYNFIRSLTLFKKYLFII